MMDRRTQRRIWQRVYGEKVRSFDWQQLEQCYRRELTDHDYYDRFRDDPVYGPAFCRLADEAMEHCKMLKQMLGK